MVSLKKHPNLFLAFEIFCYPPDPVCLANREVSAIVDQECKFPFKYDGITHNACIFDEKNMLGVQQQ